MTQSASAYAQTLPVPHPLITAQVLQAYQLPADTEILPFGNGHINQTYLLKAADRKLILQQINTAIFPSPADLVQNALKIEQHLLSKQQQGLYALEILRQQAKTDGSYLAGIWGNWVLALDQDSVWWGPGQQSSLLLSNNARPIAAVRLSRHSWQADTRPWLQWLGPWNITTFVGQDAEMEKLFSSDEPNNTKYWGGRATIRPWPAVELGLSRVIQWGGTGRSNSFTTLWDLVSYDKTDEIPADQRAALDLSYHLQAFGWPLTAYAEIADDDNQSGLPDKALSLFGVRSYWGEQNAIHTVNLEYSDTFLDCENSLQRGNCAYQGEVFPQGYRRFGRVIGSGYGADAKVLSAGYHYQTIGGVSWSGHLYRANYHAEALPGQLTSDSVWQLKMEHRRPVMKGLLSIQLRLAEKSDFRPEFDQSYSVAGSWEYRY